MATTPSNVVPKNELCSTGSHTTAAWGKRDRNAATSVGDASTPHTVQPSAISVSETGTPEPQTTSRTEEPVGSACAHLRIVATPNTGDRAAMKRSATASHPFE